MVPILVSLSSIKGTRITILDGILIISVVVMVPLFLELVGAISGNRNGGIALLEP